MIDKSIKEFGAGSLGQIITTVVVDVVEMQVLVLEFEVVPVLAAHEHAAIAVLQFQVVHALEDL
ncbi:hypothetical protein D3C87_1296670 [compost metagenome]